MPEPMSVIFTIVERGKGAATIKLFTRNQVYLHTQFPGKGTATSEIMDILGLGSTEKDIIISYATSAAASLLLNKLDNDLRGAVTSGGIAFSIPLTGLSNLVLATITYKTDLKKGDNKVSRGLPHPTGGFADSPDAKWSAHAVIRILQDETYTGVLVQGRQETHNHKLKNIRHKPSEEWVRAENAHEPIIQKRDFELVRQIMGLDTRTAPDGEGVYLFSGLLVCGCCGARMTRKTNTVKGKKYIYYHCPTGKKNGCDHPVMLKESDLSACVLKSIQAHIQSVVSLEELLDSISEEQVNRELISGYREQIADNEVKLDEARRFKATLYENFVGGLIGKKDYQDLKGRYTARAEQAQRAIDLLRGEIEKAVNNNSDRLRWTQHFKEFSTMTELDRRAVIAMVQSIRVVGKEDLEITFRYMSEYEQTLEKLTRSAKAERRAG